MEWKKGSGYFFSGPVSVISVPLVAGLPPVRDRGKGGQGQMSEIADMPQIHSSFISFLGDFSVCSADWISAGCCCLVP